jgi:hypothetical protein
MLKQKALLIETLYRESYERLAFWADGSWCDVGTGYAAWRMKQPGETPVTYLSRAGFYGATKRECAMMVKAIDACIEDGTPYTVVYEKLKLGVREDE